MTTISWQEALLLLFTLTLVISTYRSEQKDKARQRRLKEVKEENTGEEAKLFAFTIEEALSEEINIAGISHNVISFAHLREHLQEVVEHIAFKNSYKIETTIVTMNAKACVAIVPIGEYKRMKKLYEEMESTRIEAIIKERCGEGKEVKYISLEELMEIRKNKQQGSAQ